MNDSPSALETMREQRADEVEKKTVYIPGVPLEKKLEASDRLLLENFYLKIQNLVLQQERLGEDLKKSVQLRQRLQQEMVQVQVELTKRYGVDLQHCDIGDDGTITPKAEHPQAKKANGK